MNDQENDAAASKPPENGHDKQQTMITSAGYHASREAKVKLKSHPDSSEMDVDEVENPKEAEFAPLKLTKADIGKGISTLTRLTTLKIVSESKKRNSEAVTLGDLKDDKKMKEYVTSL